MADEDAPPPYEEATGNAPPPTVPTKRPVPSAPPPAVFNTGYVPPQGDQDGNPWAYQRTSGYPYGSGGGYDQQQGYQQHGQNSGHPQGYNRGLQPGYPPPQQGYNSGPQPGYPPPQQGYNVGQQPSSFPATSPGYYAGHQQGYTSPRQGFTSGQQPGYQPQQQGSNPNQNQSCGPDRARGGNNINNAVRSNMCLAVCATVCCWPLGLIAIMSECEARDAVQNGDLTHAKEASDKARSMSWISLFVGGCVIGFAVFFGLIVGLTSR